MKPTQQIPGVYHRRIGEIVVSTIADGYLDGAIEVVHGIAPEETRRLLAANLRPGRRTSVNCFVIHSAGRVALVDNGCGNKMQATGGRLLANLAAAGITPADVDTVIQTHMHPDHSNGLTDDAGNAIFSNAELVVHESEYKHWHDDGAMARADETSRLRNFQHAREQVKPYAARMKPFTKSQEVFPGVTAMPIPGHTPGHTGYMISSGGESLFIWGDIIHVPEIQVPFPAVTMAFDVDPDQARATRARVFDMVATDRLLIGGMHVHFPGLARLARREAGFHLLNEPWVHYF
jgi:glyoxylase-like metal-dependent hydrolase (beta-lactamase superfamily II)